LGKDSLIYGGMVGAALAIIGGLLSQGSSTRAASGSLNLTPLFSPGADINETLDALREALPQIRDSVEKAKPFLALQLGGYVLFALGFLGVWRVTRRILALAAFFCLVLAGVMSMASSLILPTALEEMVNALSAGRTAEELAPAVPSLLLLAGAGLLGLVGLVAGFISGGYEFYRVGRELDHDFLRGSGVLMMAAAVLSVIPLLGGLIVYAAIASIGLSFHLLARHLATALKAGLGNGQVHDRG